MIMDADAVVYFVFGGAFGWVAASIFWFVMSIKYVWKRKR